MGGRFWDLIAGPVSGPLYGSISGRTAMITNGTVIIAVRPEIDPINGPETGPSELYLAASQGKGAHRYGKGTAGDSEASWGCSTGALVKLRRSRPTPKKGCVDRLQNQPRLRPVSW